MNFKIEYTKRAQRDLKPLSTALQKKIIQDTIELESNPFPFKNKVKRIQGFKFPCYRLRVEYESASFRIFYGIQNDIIFILRVISKKDADKIIKSLKTLEFPPKIYNWIFHNIPQGMHSCGDSILLKKSVSWKNYKFWILNFHNVPWAMHSDRESRNF